MNDYVKQGKLEVYCGPMKSGKSRYLLTRLDKLNYVKNINIKLFKPKIDNRSEGINSRFLESKFECILINQDNPREILNHIDENTDVIFIDEIQFFSPQIKEVLQELIKSQKHIISGGLDMDFRGETFGPMGDILSIATRIIKLKGVCDYPNCNRAATHTQRLINNKPANFNDPIILIGDEKEGYECRCSIHHEIIKN